MTAPPDALPPGGRPAPADGVPQPGAKLSRRPDWRWFVPSWPLLVLAALTYPPLLLTAPGMIGADTKTYLYVDPGRMLERAVSMWDPRVGAGTVTHQNIGYLYPQGLFYWIFDFVGLPDWVAQRLWTASIMFAAGAGVMFLLRTFRWPDRWAFVAALGYTLTPYVLEYEARISAILLPYAGLGWLIGVTVRGLRAAEPGRAGWKIDGWRWPVVFALIVTSIGSINASSLILIMLGPLLWVPFAIWGTRDTTLGAATGMISRAVIAMVLTSAWWMAGLYTQAGYGLNVLAFTETVETVAGSSQASEILRGLGNWFFYGEDALGPWISPAEDYTQALWLIVASFTIPILALAAAGLLRWGHKAYFVSLVMLGTTIGVGVYPYDDPAPLGRVFRDFAEGSTAGLALRSLPRAVPMVVLGLSVLLAGALAAAAARVAATASTSQAAPVPSPVQAHGAGHRSHRQSRTGLKGWRRPETAPVVATAIVLVLIVVNMAPLYRGQFIESRLDRPETIPAYEYEAAAALDAGDPDTRVLELPGADFAHYRWGASLDPVLTGLSDRPHLLRELIPYGEAGTVDLLRSLDRRLQEGVLETESVPDVARLFGVSEVVLRSNLEYERFRSPRPRATWDLFTTDRPTGLSEPEVFGPPVPDSPGIPFTDEITLGTDADVPDPPSLAVFDVTDPKPIVRSSTVSSPLLVDGNGEALVDAAAAGLLADVVANDRVVLYTAAMADDPAALERALNDGAALLVTDTNRLRAEGWTGIRENFGYVEQPGVSPLQNDSNDNRLPMFPEADESFQTVAQLSAPGTAAEIAAVRATDYGNNFSYGPSDRPVRGIDGDVTTAWRVGAFTDPVGERWQVTLAAPTTTDQIRLVQPVNGPRNRWITRATLTFDGGSPVTVELTDASRTAAGQVVTFDERTFSQFDITVDETNVGRQRVYDTYSAVGLAEVEIPGNDGLPLVADEVLRLPTDLLTVTGDSSIDHPLILQISRDRANPAEPFKVDTESMMARTFALPTARGFTLTGTARISAYAADDRVDASLGRPADAATTTSSGRLPGDIAARSASAFDGDPSTAWSPGIGPQSGGVNWIEASAPGPFGFDSVSLTVLADGKHSVPTKIGVEVDGVRVATLDLPPLPDTGPQQVTLPVPPSQGSTVRLVVDEVREVTSIDTISHVKLALPVAIAEIDVAGLRTTAPPDQIPSPCRADLITVDGQPVGVQVIGSSEDAVDRRGLDVRTCNGPLQLGPGPHVVRTADGDDTGIDIDRLVFSSLAGGAPATSTATAPPPSRPAPEIGVTATSDTGYRVDVTGAKAGTPFWLVLGQSLSRGWTATVDGKDLGEPALVDGYANGWRITPTSSAFTVELRWAPQRLVWIALVVSAVAVLASLVLLAVTWRRRPGRRVAGPAGDVGANGQPVDTAAPAVRSASLSSASLSSASLSSASLSSATLSAAPDLPTWEPLRRRRGTGSSSSSSSSGLGQQSPRPRLPLRTTALVSLATGLVALVVAGPVAGLVVVLAAALGLTTSWGRLPLRLGPPVCLAVCALYVLQVQARYDLPTTGSWVAAFSKVAIVSWLAVLLLATDMVVVAATRRWGQGEPAAGDSGQDSDGDSSTTTPPTSLPGPGPAAAPSR